MNQSAAQLLDDVQTFLERFISYPSKESAHAHALWIAHAHFVEAFENTPRLAFLSPEPGSGKSRAMELTEALVPNPVLSVNATVSYIFRKISDPDGIPTLLLDEIDTVFTGRAGDANEDLRGLINSGYRKGATVGRAVTRGREIFTEDWPSYCALALAGLNSLPDTIMTRSIVIAMKRRPRGIKLEPYRRRVNETESAEVKDRLQEWASADFLTAAELWPELPESISDRDADVWEPLIALADIAGGHWPETARRTAVLMVATSKEKNASLGILLLGHIRDAFGDTQALSTNDLLAKLHELENAPWSNIKGLPIDGRFLSRMLRKYDIEPPRAIRLGGQVIRGVNRADFYDAWERYLPAQVSKDSKSPEGVETSDELF